MIKKLALSALIPLSLFSYELNFSKKFSTSINPDILTTKISANLQNKDERFISDNLESINDFIKENKEIQYKNGRFHLTPKYTYKNSNRKFTEYIGNISYMITSKDANTMNEFISELIDVKDKLNVKTLKLNINNTTWQISDELHNQSQDKLRLEAINWITNYAKNLNSSCTISKINIGSRNNHYPSPMMYKSMRATSDISPAKSIQSTSINPNFTLECK
jgi:predicted secreted protein